VQLGAQLAQVLDEVVGERVVVVDDEDLDARRVWRADPYDPPMAADEEATGWFEELYLRAAGGEAVIPWDRGEPNPRLVEWTTGRSERGAGRRALVIGAGLGDDAEHVAALGYETVAFDIAPTAVAGARERFPGSRVSYLVADLLAPPADWRGAFDLVVESITVQALPERLHAEATARVASFVAPGGTLLVLSGAREAGERVDGPPWPLTRAELEAFAAGGLRAVRIEALRDSLRRWRAEFARPA
jgi:SAM-dependent methyltransferase